MSSIWLRRLPVAEIELVVWLFEATLGGYIFVLSFVGVSMDMFIPVRTRLASFCHRWFGLWHILRDF